MYKIKKYLMEKIIDKRKKANIFDYEKSENFTLNTNGDGKINNSYYFSAHSYEKKESLYIRLALRDNNTSEVWAFYNNNENYYVLKNIFYSSNESPLSVKKLGNNWSFYFKGLLTENDKNEVYAEIDCVFSETSSPLDFFHDMPSVRTATAMAQEKWTKTFFKEVQENNQVHYEQVGNLKGTVSIQKDIYNIDLPCVRDHSYGKRVWGYMNNHLWLMAIDKDYQINFSMVSYPSLSILEVGNIYKNNFPVEYMLKAHYDRTKLINKNITDTFNLQITTTSNKKISIETKLLHYDAYAFENGNYILNEGIAEFNIDGILTRGIFEIGINGDKKRFMNGKDIRRIKE